MRPVAPPRPPGSRADAFVAVGLGLLVLGWRWMLLARFGSDVPYWDEWPAAAWRLFEPWVQGTLQLRDLFALHNEHRIVLTRLWELAFFTLNERRWDPLLVQTANAIVAALAASLLAFFVLRRWPERERLRPLLPLVVVALLPFGYSNLLIAFQSQFAFLSLCAVLALGSVDAPELSRARLAGALLCAALALFTVGTGVAVAAVLVVAAMPHVAAASRSRGRWRWLLAAAVMLLALGWHMGPGGMELPSASLAATAAGRYAAWPAGNLVTLVTGWPDTARYFPSVIATWPTSAAPAVGQFAGWLRTHPFVLHVLYWGAGLALHAPLLWLVARGRREPGARFVLLLALWTLLNAAAMVLARAEFDIVPPRYQDILALGLLANALAWLIGLRAVRFGPDLPRPLRLWLLAGWPTFALACVLVTAVGIFGVQLPRKRVENRAAAALVQRFLVTNDPEIFRNQPPNHVPWPQQERLLTAVLRDRVVRTFLPRGVLPPGERPPAPLASRAAAAARAAGGAVVVAGSVLLSLGVLRLRRST